MMAKANINWQDIRNDYERGMSQAELRKKYSLSPSTLATKIKRDGWELSQEQSTNIKAFSDSLAKIS